MKLNLATFARLAGLGAFGACGGLAAAIAGIVFFIRPSRTGGMDQINSLVAWISLGGLIVALIIVHIAIGKQLLRLGQGAERRHPL